MNSSPDKSLDSNDDAIPVANPTPASDSTQTALDSILSRGQHAEAAALVLAIAGEVGEGRGANLPAIGIKHQFRPLVPTEEPEPAALPPRAWLLRNPDSATLGVICSESILNKLREVLSERGGDLYRENFYKFIGSGEVAVCHFTINGLELADEQFAACVEKAEAMIDESANSPKDLEYKKLRRRRERECLADHGIRSVASLIDAYRTDGSGLMGFENAVKCAGLGPEILAEPLPCGEYYTTADRLRENSHTVLLHEDSFCERRRIYLWKSREHTLWICNRVQDQDPFFSSINEANFSHQVSAVDEIDTFLTSNFGYSLTGFDLDPVQIYAWVMKGDRAFEKRCRQYLRSSGKAAAE